MAASPYDSLGDAYFANGQNELGLLASQRAVELLPKDRGSEARTKAIRERAEQKIATVKAQS